MLYFAINYRKIENIPHNMGTAVNVQSMVFGNLGSNSATGVAFTRNPSTGKNVFYGEWLENAQGEDVVAGIRTPNPINEDSRSGNSSESITLEQKYPDILFGAGSISDIPNAKKVIPNIATSISEIKARIIDGIEHGYDDAQQVYENLEDEFYEGLSKEEQEVFGSFHNFLEEIEFEELKSFADNCHKELA